MSFKVFLKFTKGEWKGLEIDYDQKECVRIGRLPECNIRLPETYDTVSRCHCLLDINPPFVTVKDLGSKNGTYLNGKKLGQRSSSPSVEEDEGYPMKTGDRLQLGGKCEIQLKVEFPEYCAHRICDIMPQSKIKNDDCRTICTACHGNKKENALKIAGYSNIRKIGEGGMGKVWLVLEEKTGKQKAMKFMLTDAPSDEQKKAWFLREISIGKQIKHPNIAEQYDSGEKDGIYYILMEYCPGGNVKDLMTRKDLKIAYKKDGQTRYEKIFWGGSEEALKERIKMATHIILQTLAGLDYLHHVPVETTLPDGARSGNGLVYRDVKPENILLMDDTLYPAVKLADFGLAKAFDLAGLSRNTYTGYYAGCLKYISRQQIRDYRFAKPEVDVWAAAAVCYTMITGLPPKNFAGSKSSYSVACFDEVVPIRERDPRIPVPLADVIDQALQEKPERGIKKALELKNNIEAVITKRWN